MRKLKLLSALVAIVALLSICLTACGLFGEPKDAPKVKFSTITVYVGDIPQTFTATNDTTVDVGPLSQSGGYLVGIEDSAGRKYFDEAGRSLLPWNDANPTIFYAKFAPLNTLSYTFETMANKTISIGTQEDYEIHSFAYSFQNTKEVQFLSALKGNPERQVQISYSFDAKKQDNIWKPNLYVKVYANGDETLQSITINEQSVDFKHYSYSVTVPARRLTNGFKISFMNTDFALCAKYIKYVDCKIEILGE